LNEQKGMNISCEPPPPGANPTFMGGGKRAVCESIAERFASCNVPRSLLCIKAALSASVPGNSGFRLRQSRLRRRRLCHSQLRQPLKNKPKIGCVFF
jgi:hypothetical protein